MPILPFPTDAPASQSADNSSLQIQSLGGDSAKAVPTRDFLEKWGVRKAVNFLVELSLSTKSKVILGVVVFTAVGIASFLIGGPIGAGLYLLVAGLIIGDIGLNNRALLSVPAYAAA